MASRKRILKTYWLAIICFSTTGFLVTLKWNDNSDQTVYSSERLPRGGDTNASTEEPLPNSALITGTKIITTVVTENVTTSSQYSTLFSRSTTDETPTQKSTQLMTSFTTELVETSTLLSSFPITNDGKVTSLTSIYFKPSELSITTTKTSDLSDVNFFKKIIIIVSFVGIIMVLMLALIIFSCSRLTSKRSAEKLEVSEDGWNEMELDGTRLATNNENVFKEQNVTDTDIMNSPKPRLSISRPTEMKYATVNQTFATFTPGPETFRKVRDRNSKIMKTGLAKGLMYSEPDLLNNTIPSLKLSVKSPEDTLQWEPNVAYQGFDPRIYHSTENNFIGSYKNDFSDDYYAVIDM